MKAIGWYNDTATFYLYYFTFFRAYDINLLTNWNHSWYHKTWMRTFWVFFGIQSTIWSFWGRPIDSQIRFTNKKFMTMIISHVSIALDFFSLIFSICRPILTINTSKLWARGALFSEKIIEKSWTLVTKFWELCMCFIPDVVQWVETWVG